MSHLHDFGMYMLTSAFTLALVAGCGGRDAVLDAPIGSPRVVGLSSAVAVVDDPIHRVILLVGEDEQRLSRTEVQVGHGVISATASLDKTRLFVLSAGDNPRRSERDELPSLTVVQATEGKPGVFTTARYALSAPLSGLALDPQGKWAVLYAAGATNAFVENPNELVLVDLESPTSEPKTRTVRSFGGRPQRLTFTGTLSLPAGPRRLLVVETQQDVTLLDLDHAYDTPPRPEITVRLGAGDGTKSVIPGGVVIDDGDPASSEDARVAVRPLNDNNVVTLELGPASASSPNDFLPKVNLTDVGGVASDLAFVHTDGGLRIAALVPTRSAAVLIEPETSLTTLVALPQPYGRVSLVTGSAGGAGTGSDVALLYSGSGTTGTSTGNGVAFWSLGATTGKPYRSVEVLALGGVVSNVLDVPTPHPDLKILQTSGENAFYVLDLASRTASPLTTASSASLSVAPDGLRLWAFAWQSTRLSSIALDNLHPVPLVTDRRIDGVFDIARHGGGRVLVAVHGQGGLGVTVFDAEHPDTATARLYSAILQEGL